MSDQIWLAVIAVAALVILVVLLGPRFKGVKAKLGGEGLEAEIQTHSPVPPAEPIRPPEAASSASTRLTVRNVAMKGVQHQVSAHGNTEVSDIRMEGEGHSITAGSEDPQKT